MNAPGNGMLAKMLQPFNFIRGQQPASNGKEAVAKPVEIESTLVERQDEVEKFQKKVPLKRGLEIEIGRYMGVSITSSRPRYELANAAISAKHAYMGVDETGVYIVDIGTEGTGSRNGTFVNGVRVNPRIKFYVVPNDEVWLGKPFGEMRERLMITADQMLSEVSVSFRTFAAR